MTTPETGRPPSKAILIVDDHPVLRRGLAALIESESDLAVCGEAATRAAALKAIRETRPDLVIVDLSLGDDDGLDLIILSGATLNAYVALRLGETAIAAVEPSTDA